MKDFFLAERSLFAFNMSLGSEVGLAILAVLYLFFSEETVHNRYKKKIAVMGMGILVVLLIPGVLVLLNQTHEFQRAEAIFGEMPVGLLVAFAATCLWEQKKSKRQRIGLWLVLLLLFIAGVSVPCAFTTENVGFSYNAQKISYETIQIAKATEKKETFLPEQIYGQMTEYSSDKNYITDLSSTNNSYSVSKLLATALEKNCVCIVVPKNTDDEATMKSYMFKRIKTTKHYVIYQKKE